MIKYKTNEFTFGDTVYIKTDPYQEAYILIGVLLHPSYRADDPATPKFILSNSGDKVEVYDFEVSKERGEAPPIEEDLEL